MTISREIWKKYVAGLDAVQNKAKDLTLDYIAKHETETKEGRQALCDYAYGLATKYGEAAAAYACQMYDATAELEGANLEPAQPAETATYSEVCKAVNGTIKVSDLVCAAAVYRLVKLAGQDTTLRNAVRDKIYFAWVPMGDTCPYCLMKAAGGWQRADASLVGHSDHIHGNCDCAYATKTEPGTIYKGYAPEKYESMINNAEGDTTKQKLNSMRRAAYARNKDKTDNLNAGWLTEIDVN